MLSAPDWVTIIPNPDASGWIVGRDGRRWRLSDPGGLVQQLNRNARSRGLVFDYEHATEVKAPKGEEALAAGWSHEFRVADGAVQARVDWTQRGRAKIENREYRYVSPALIFRRSNQEIVDISSVGLTNMHNLQLPALNCEECETALSAEERKIIGLLGVSEGDYLTERTASNAEAIATNRATGNRPGADADERRIAEMLGVPWEDYLREKRKSL